MGCTWTNLAPPPTNWWEFAYFGGRWVTWKEVCRKDAETEVFQDTSVSGSLYAITYEHLYALYTQHETYISLELTRKVLFNYMI